jgi:hypothetical protein
MNDGMEMTDAEVATASEELAQYKLRKLRQLVEELEAQRGSKMLPWREEELAGVAFYTAHFTLEDT